MHGKGFYSMRISGEAEEGNCEDVIMSLDIGGRSVTQKFIEDVIMAAVSGINANIIDRRLDEAFGLDSDEEGENEGKY